MSIWDFGFLMIVVGFLLGAGAFWLLARILQDRHETRLANFEFAGLRHTLPVFDQVIPRAWVSGNPPFGNAPKPGRHAAPTTWTEAINLRRYADLARRCRNFS